jgi:flagellar motor switch protein FliN/FliY
MENERAERPDFDANAGDPGLQGGAPGGGDDLVEELREAAGAAALPRSASVSGAGAPNPDEELRKAMLAEATGQTGIRMPAGPAVAHRAEFDTLHAGPASRTASNIDLLMDVRLPVSIELGRTELAISDILELGSGSIVELDKLAGEPVDVFVNGRPLAKGEVVVLDEHFGVRITSLVSRSERLEGLGS